MPRETTQSWALPGRNSDDGCSRTSRGKGHAQPCPQAVSPGDGECLRRCSQPHTRSWRPLPSRAPGTRARGCCARGIRVPRLPGLLVNHLRIQMDSGEHPQAFELHALLSCFEAGHVIIVLCLPKQPSKRGVGGVGGLPQF